MGRRLGTLSIEELFREIHRINPTDRGLPPAEEERRYRQKSALQSELIRRFGDHLEVQAEGEDLVVLRHRLSGRDAAHARISRLDEDARSWVRWQLDTGEEVEVLRPRSGGSGSEEDLLARANSALEAYDYPLAEELFREAFEASRGARPEAEALLDLLVDHLAMDAEALELRARLGRAATRSPRVRGLLATAASRLGRSQEALELAQGLGGAAKVYEEVARQALAAEDLPSARSALGRLEEVDPSHPALRSLGARLDELLKAARAARREPAERALSEMLATANPEAIRESARLLLAEHPDSSLARSELAKAERVLAERERERQRRLAEERDRGRRAEAERRLEDVQRLLPSPEGLLAWTQLEEPLRKRLREPRLEVLEELCEATRWRRCEVAVQALLAREFVGSVAERVEVLAPHRELLARTRFRGLLPALEEELRVAEAQRQQVEERRRAEAEREALERRYQEAVARRDWISARRIARSQDGPRWASRLREAGEELDRAYGLRVYGRPPYEDLRDYRLALPTRGDGHPMVGQEQVFLGHRCGPVVWIRRVELQTGRVLEAVELRPLLPMADPTYPEVHGDLVFLYSRGSLVVLRHCPRWELADAIDLTAVCGAEPKDLTVVDGRYGWVDLGERCVVLDLVTRRVEAFTHAVLYDHALHTGPRPLVARVAEDGVSVCRPRAPDQVVQRGPGVQGFRCPVLASRGRLLYLSKAGPEAYAPTQLHVVQDNLAATLSLPEMGPSARIDLRVVVDRDLVFLCGPDARGASRLLAFRLQDLEPKPLWSVAAPPLASLIGDREGSAAALICLGYDRTRVVVLGEEAPTFSQLELLARAGPSDLAGPFPWVGEEDLDQHRRRAEERHADVLDDPVLQPPADAELVGLVVALHRRAQPQRGDAMLSRALERDGRAGVAGFVEAHRLANEQRWAEALTAFQELDPQRLSSGQRFLAEVVTNACLANLGHIEEALDAARRAHAIEPHNVGALQLVFTFEALLGLVDEAAFSEAFPEVQRFLAALTGARRALLRRDWEGALRLGDLDEVWTFWSPGGLYLLCLAWQALLPEDEGSILRARSTAGGLLEALEQKRAHLPLLELEASADTMRALALELLDGLVPGARATTELELEDLVLAWEDGLDARELAEELGCSVIDVYSARRRFGLEIRPSDAEERAGWLRRCGWSEGDIEAQLG